MYPWQERIQMPRSSELIDVFSSVLGIARVEPQGRAS